MMKIRGQYILRDNNIDGDMWLSSNQRIGSLQSTIETLVAPRFMTNFINNWYIFANFFQTLLFFLLLEEYMRNKWKENTAQMLCEIVF